MILIESTWWPLIAVGWVPDAMGVPPDHAALIDEQRLSLSDDLRVALVVRGNGSQAAHSQREVLTWLHRLTPVLASRVKRLAWIVEDDDVRACTDAWMGLSGEGLFDAPTATFRRVEGAIRWLLDDPFAQQLVRSR